jgi:hypothetical protein
MHGPGRSWAGPLLSRPQFKFKFRFFFLDKLQTDAVLKIE